MSVNEKMTAIADAIREHTGDTGRLCLDAMAESIPNVYKAGQQSMVDESKIIPKTISGNYISVDDVSEIPHSVGCKVRGVNDLTTVSVTKCGSNICKSIFTGNLFVAQDSGSVIYESASIYSQIVPCLPNITYTISGDFSAMNSGYTRIAFTNEYPAVGVATISKRRDGIASKNVITFTTPDECNYILLMTGTSSVNEYPDLQLNIGSNVLPFEPYSEQILTPSADGTVEGMTSLSPYMNIFCDNKDVNIELSYNKSWGMQTEYDRFWDAYQNYGNKTTYNSAFFEWDEKIFYPKYDIKPLTVSAMFQYFNRYGGNLLDLKKRLEECGVVLDCSNSYGVVSYMFYLAYVSVVPELNLAGTGNLNQTFDSSKIETIEKLIVGEKNTFTKTFDNCAELINIVMEGTIASSVSFPHSNKLSKNSIVSILNTLSSTVTGQTLTLNSEAVNTAFETSFGVADGSSSEEWTSLVASKTNWTITLV